MRCSEVVRSDDELENKMLTDGKIIQTVLTEIQEGEDIYNEADEEEGKKLVTINEAKLYS